jgi:hypothetical protein
MPRLGGKTSIYKKGPRPTIPTCLDLDSLKYTYICSFFERSMYQGVLAARVQRGVERRRKCIHTLYVGTCANIKLYNNKNAFL